MSSSSLLPAVASTAASTATEGHNDLIIEWLSELRDQAKKAHSKAEFTYLKALKSAREYKEPLRCGADCKKLKGVGEKICSMIEKKLKSHLGDSYVPPVPAGCSPARRAQRPHTALLEAGQSPILQMFNVRKRIHGPASAAKSPTVCSPQDCRSPVRKVSRPARNRRYIPVQGSSGFAILVSLLRYELEYQQKLVNKLDLQDMAQRYTTTLVGQANTAQRYPGWATIKTLLTKELVARTDARNSYYFLTEEGHKLARNLAKFSPMLRDFSAQYLGIADPDIPSDSDDEVMIQLPTTTTVPTFRPFIFTPGDYEIILCIDTRERIATNFCSDKNAAFASALQKQDVKCEIRTLPLGDFIWIAREKPKTADLGRFTSMSSDINTGASLKTAAPQPDIRKELVLDLIIERKRIDDLASSIKDRRWDEQKYRLLRCGLRRPTYIIEYMGKPSKKLEHGGLQPEALEQAMTNCEIDGFDVKRTDNFEETVRYLTFMSRWLERRYTKQMLMSAPNKEALEKTAPGDFQYITFNEFAVNSSKIHVFTAKEMLVKHLLQVKGLSMPKIQVIVAKWPTLAKLLEAYERRPDLWSKHNMLTDLKTDKMVGTNRRLGPAISKKMYDYYNTIE